MGEDWIRKTEKRWRQSLRTRVIDFADQSLLEGTEEELVVYPCRILEARDAVVPGARLTIYQYSSQATVAVLLGNQVVGHIEGDAAKDLKTKFDMRPDLCRMICATVASVDMPSYRVELAVSRTTAGGQG